MEPSTVPATATLRIAAAFSASLLRASFPPDPPYLKDAYSPLSCGSDLCGKTVIRSVAVDAGGNVYFSNSTNVFRLSPDGTVTTIAGNGTYGYSGDGGTATAAQLSFPAGIAVDDAGNIYIADAGNNAVRVLTLARQPASLSVRPAVVAQGECFTVTVANGTGMTLDVQYLHENGPVQIIRGWPVLMRTALPKFARTWIRRHGTTLFSAFERVQIPAGFQYRLPSLLSGSPSCIEEGGDWPGFL